jgi:hypothetical protein
MTANTPLMLEKAVDFDLEPSALDQLLAADISGSACPSPETTQSGIVVGTLAGFTESGIPLVRFPGGSVEQPIPAKHICAMTRADVGHEVVLTFEAHDHQSPIIMGIVQPAIANERASVSANVTLDGKQLTLSAKNEIILSCGKASITLTRAGKIILRGAYILSRSSGVNRIKGGSVQIN